MNSTQVQNIIKKDEGATLEFKLNFNDEVIETLVAFANTSGGAQLYCFYKFSLW